MSCAGSDLGRALAGLALLALTACATIRADLPDGFLRLESAADELKAVTADDAILWVRQFDDREGGGLGFWTAALRRDLVDRRGYVPVGEPERIEDGAGREGTLQTFRTRANGASQGYLIAVFVIGSGVPRTIRTAEFVAPGPLFDERIEAVRASLATLAP